MVSKAISAAQDLVIVVPGPGPGGKIPSHFLEAWCIHRRPNDRPQPIKRTEEQVSLLQTDLFRCFLLSSIN